MSLDERLEDLAIAHTELDEAAVQWIESRVSSDWKDNEEAEKRLDGALASYKRAKSKLDKTGKRLGKRNV